MIDHSPIWCGHVPQVTRSTSEASYFDQGAAFYVARVAAYRIETGSSSYSASEECIGRTGNIVSDKMNRILDYGGTEISQTHSHKLGECFRAACAGTVLVPLVVRRRQNRVG